jgi:UDP:flavonoid glycosyltransferase YjiC (YdhE family)
MRILISTIGSRGDVQPFLALAVGLQQASHHVILAAPYNFAEWINSYGVEAYPIQFNPQEFLQQPEIKAATKSRNVLRQLRLMREVLGPKMVEALEEFGRAAADTDFIIQTGTGPGGVEVATARSIPMAFGFLQPFAPTRAFPSFFLPPRFSLGGRYNYLTHTLMFKAIWPNFGGPINQWRAQMDLPPCRSLQQMLNARQQFGTPWLFGYSPHVLPKPDDWAEHHNVTGYWFLEAQPDWQPPKALIHFLENGPPPAYIGFGSMRDEDSEQLTRLVLQALELSGQRGFLLSGWGGLAHSDQSDNLFFLEDVPHSWLFPRMSAVIHHGGAGTTAAVLRAGVPNIITPFALDQYAWSDRVVKLGVGPKMPSIKKLTAEQLAQAIQKTVTDTALRNRAEKLGQKIRAENGVTVAIELIERHAADFKRQPK